MNPLVLFVDNDIANLVVFESSVEGVLPYRTATHSNEALQILGSEEIGVLLMGQPETSKAELLETVRRDHPDTIRMVLAREPEPGGLPEVIEEGRACSHLPHDWSAKELRITLEAALERYRMARRLRELEAKLQAAERVAALGVAAAELAHEIRNPLSALASNLSVSKDELSDLRSSLGGPDSARLEARLSSLTKVLDDCLEATTSILEITRSVELASRGPAEPEALDVREIVQHVLRSFQTSSQGRGIVEFEARKVPLIRGSRTRIRQVVTNLVQNGLQAASSTPDRSPRVVVRLWHTIDEIVLEVEDNGPGIAPEVLGRIFEPFFTTKAERGTGLGLSLSKRIVEEHEGSIEVSSDREGGTRFLVRLPIL